MKKTRRLSTTAAAALVVVGIVPPTSRNLATHLAMFDDNGPPITVSDGSIHADTHRLLHFFFRKTPKTKYEMYTANAYDRDYIRFDGFTDDSGDAPPSPLQNTGGWHILISNGEPGKEINQDSISLCSTARELPSPTCMLGTPDPTEKDKWVYLETHPHARPTNPPPAPDAPERNGQNGKWSDGSKRLDFSDTRGGCENGGVCDHIAYIIIKTMNRNSPPRQDGSTVPLPGPDGHKYTCNVVDQCTISIGRY